MSSSATTQKGMFYGWFIAAACFILTATLGETLFSYGVFFNPLEQEFGWSRSAVSSGFTALTIGYSISVFVAGRLADRYQPRYILLISAVLSGSGIAMCSTVHSVEQLMFFMFIAGLGSGATFAVPASTVMRWFRNRRGAGTALSVVVSGTGVGQLVFTPLINGFILNSGWRNAYVYTGLIFFALIVISAIIIRLPRYADINLPGKDNARKEPAGWRTSKAIVTPAYIAIVFAVCVVMIAIQTVVVHLVPHATDMGMSSATAAAALGLLGALTIPGRLTTGIWAARLGWQKTLALGVFGMAVAVLCLLFLRDTWMLYVFVFLFGIFWGIRMVAQLGILGEYFGMRSAGELIGITSGISNLGGAAAPYIAGFMFDTTGSYSTAFAVMAALLLAGGIGVVALKKPQPPL